MAGGKRPAGFYMPTSGNFSLTQCLKEADSSSSYIYQKTTFLHALQLLIVYLLIMQVASQIVKHDFYLHESHLPAYKSKVIKFS